MQFPVPWSSARWRAVESPCTPAPTTTKCADERAVIHASCRDRSGLVLGSAVARRPRIRSGATVVLLGTLDTKGAEYAYLRDRGKEAGVDVLVVDRGIPPAPLTEPNVEGQEGAA